MDKEYVIIILEEEEEEDKECKRHLEKERERERQGRKRERKRVSFYKGNLVSWAGVSPLCVCVSRSTCISRRIGYLAIKIITLSTLVPPTTSRRVASKQLVAYPGSILIYHRPDRVPS